MSLKSWWQFSTEQILVKVTNEKCICLFQGCDEFRDHTGWPSKENHEQHSDYASTNAAFTRNWHPSVMGVSPFWGRSRTTREHAGLQYLHRMLLEDSWCPRSFLQWREDWRSTYRLELLSATRIHIKREFRIHHWWPGKQQWQ